MPENPEIKLQWVERGDQS